jgi:2'-5' RNA ligase
VIAPPPPANDAFAATWERFCAAPHLLGPTPGVRERWAAGRADYAVWAIRIHAEAILQRATHLQAALTSWTRPTPPTDLHVTTWVAGFPSEHPTHNDDIHEDALKAQAEALRGHRSFRIAIGGANSFTTAPFLEVHDLDGGLAQVRAVLQQQGPPELRFAPYVPHVTLGTATADHSVAPLRARLEPHRHQPLIEVQVQRIEQLRFDATQPGARLHTHHTVLFE